MTQTSKALIRHLSTDMGTPGQWPTRPSDCPLCALGPFNLVKAGMHQAASTHQELTKHLLYLFCHEMNSFMPVLYTRKYRHREMNYLAQNH